MSQTARRARLLEGAYTELAQASCFKPVPLPHDVTDAAQFPNIAAASAWFASLSPERRAELNEGME